MAPWFRPSLSDMVCTELALSFKSTQVGAWSPSSDKCRCGKVQTMSNIVNECP